MINLGFMSLSVIFEMKIFCCLEFILNIILVVVAAATAVVKAAIAIR